MNEIPFMAATILTSTLDNCWYSSISLSLLTCSEIRLARRHFLSEGCTRMAFQHLHSRHVLVIYHGDPRTPSGHLGTTGMVRYRDLWTSASFALLIFALCVCGKDGVGGYRGNLFIESTLDVHRTTVGE